MYTLAAIQGLGCSIFEKDSAVTGHLIHKKNRMPVAREELMLMEEDDNKHDKDAVPVGRGWLHCWICTCTSTLLIVKGKCTLVNGRFGINLRLNPY